MTNEKAEPEPMMGRWELRQGDALALLAQLPSSSVDCLITDGPYSSGGMVRADRAASTRAKYVANDSSNQRLADFLGDNRSQRGFEYWTALWLGECLRVVKPGGTGLLFTDWRQLPSTADALEAGGWVWRGVVPWCKPTARPQKGRFAAAAEYVVWGSAGPMQPDGPCLRGYFEVVPPRNRTHITQKPLGLLRELVQICPPGGIVLDPFAGSGTTGAAALLEGRRFLGFELSPHFAEVARHRLGEVDRLLLESSRVDATEGA